MTITWPGKMMASLGLAAACLMETGCGRSHDLVCPVNLAQIGQALLRFHDSQNAFPKAAISDSQGRPGLSWRVAILPYLGRKDLYEKFKLDEPWDGPHNRQLLREMPAVFACPGTALEDPSLTTYRVFSGPGAFCEPAYDKRTEKVWWVGDDGTKHYAGEPRSGLFFAAFTDGPANTLMVVEAKDAVPWTKPEELPFDPEWDSQPTGGDRHAHHGGFNARFVNGAVRHIKKNIAPSVFRTLITRAGNEVVNLDACSTALGKPAEPTPSNAPRSETDKVMYK